jgi:pimeloyl-ACP methyl ester carboxylesterase
MHTNPMHTNPMHTKQLTPTWLGGLAVDDLGENDHRAPLVLLHGLTFDRTTWRPILAELERIDPGRRVLAIDLPGHGESPTQESYTLDAGVEQINRVVEEAGLDSPVLVGHSAGSLAASVYAARFPSRGVVNVDQPLEVIGFAEFVKSLADRLRGPEFPAVWQMFQDSWHVERLPLSAQNVVRATSRPRQAVVVGYWQQILDRSIDELTTVIEETTARLRAKDTPYLYIAGDVPPPGYREWLDRHLPAATTEVWPRSSHFPHLALPGQFARRLRDTMGT